MSNQSIPKIQELSESVIHKIAAGEVVERPVSVVKELVENAIDAGATRIEVSVQTGGVESIVVKDNGCGIAPMELSIALKRHATSKIRSDEDLFQLHSLGFRGEALPSIASVSEFSLQSATAETAPVGYCIRVKNGQKSELSELAMEQGTRVEVKKLFSTTPARLKFLKREQTEWAHIADYLTAMALGHLSIEWRIFKNGKKFLFSPAVSEAQKRFFDLFGSEVSESLYPIDCSSSGLHLYGYIGHPNFSRKNPKQMYVFVNGRYVQDRLINHAITSGYRSLLMTQQYPMVLLHLNIDPAWVDVNVHPAKREVRFSQGNTIHSLISANIRRELEKSPWQQRHSEGFVAQREEAQTSQAGEAIQLSEFALESRQASRFSQSGVSQVASGETLTIHVEPQTDSGSARVGPLPVKKSDIAIERFEGMISERKNQAAFQAQTSFFPQAQIGTFPFQDLHLIGQFKATYIVCEYESSLLLIDQHAAHERIGFEELKKSFEDKKLVQQRFLNPPILEFNPQEAERLRMCLTELEKFSLEVEDFGENSFALKAYPVLLKNCQWKALIQEMVDEMMTEVPAEALVKKIDHILATMSCHRQIRANDRLSREEMKALLKQLEGTPRSYHCPHGRPVMVEISSREIEKWFKRVL